MPQDTLRALMNAIPKQAVTEATLECAPGTVSAQHAPEWKRAGINRVSLGVQSFVAAELRETGRHHTAETVQEDVETLCAAGIDNINMDLISGLPRQTKESWAHSLEWIERLHPPHASVYIFEIDDESRLGNEVLQGGARYGANHLPTESETAEFYELAVDTLRRFGLNRYEISNFARSGWESRHNLKYWRLEPYIGFGLDAHSFNGRERWSNPDTLSDYFAQHERLSGGDRELTPTDPSEERFFVGLRLTAGIQPTSQEWTRFAQPIRKWLDAGMIERSGTRLRLAPGAVLLSNEILQDFIDV